VVVPNAAWTDDAQGLLRDLVQHQPVLVQISAAKRLRDLSEQFTREAGEDVVNVDHVQSAAHQLGMVAAVVV
jgi:chlorophyllide a reductase subunit Z